MKNLLCLCLLVVGCGGNAQGPDTEIPEVAPVEMCAIDGLYFVTFETSACGASNSFEARPPRSEFVCGSTEWNCTPGDPSEFCEVNRVRSGGCIVHSTWTLVNQ